MFFIGDTGKVIHDQRELDSEYDKTFQLQALLFPFIPVSPPSHSWNSSFSSGPSGGDSSNHICFPEALPFGDVCCSTEVQA